MVCLSWARSSSCSACGYTRPNSAEAKGKSTSRKQRPSSSRSEEEQPDREEEEEKEAAEFSGRASFIPLSVAPTAPAPLCVICACLILLATVTRHMWVAHFRREGHGREFGKLVERQQTERLERQQAHLQLTLHPRLHVGVRQGGHAQLVQ